MKTFWIAVTLVVFCLASWSPAQELLVGGNMENASAWQVSHMDSQDTSEFEFNYVDAGPSAGQGGCLHVWADVPQSTNLVFWQAVVLMGGSEYEIKGAFTDLGGTLANFWCELLYDVTPPPPTGDFVGAIIVGLNTWNGTQPGIDGTFQDNFVKGAGPVFTAPGTAGVADTVYFVINVGVWAGGTPRSFDIAIDELSLVPAGGSAVDEGRTGVVTVYQLAQNFPNPFNPCTTISYVLAERSTVTLQVFDGGGRTVATLVDAENQAAGAYDVSFAAAALPTGVYYYRLQTAHFTKSKKMVLMR